MNIVLIGFKSSGKSTVGAQLASAAGFSFLDTDDAVETLFASRYASPLSCREIYTQHGADYMRDLETEVLRSLQKEQNTVIATGGGIVLRPENLTLLNKAGICVFLDVPCHILEKRLQEHATSPLFQNAGFASMYAERYPLYQKAAHIRHTVEEGHSPQYIAEHILKSIRERIKEEDHGEQ